MGSVARRFRRNIMATNMAERARIRLPRSKWFNITTPLIHYRSVMLRVLRSRRQRDRTLHDHRQRTQAIQEKRTRQVRSEGSMLKRVFNKIFKPRGNR